MATVVVPFVDLRTHRMYVVGEQVAADDPVVVGREQFFAAGAAPADRVEMTTAAPGERRNSYRGRKPRS